jgi:hypothetical protein
MALGMNVVVRNGEGSNGQGESDEGDMEEHDFKWLDRSFYQ